jgi:hypothetical protein
LHFLWNLYSLLDLLSEPQAGLAFGTATISGTAHRLKMIPLNECSKFNKDGDGIILKILCFVRKPIVSFKEGVPGLLSRFTSGLHVFGGIVAVNKKPLSRKESFPLHPGFKDATLFQAQLIHGCPQSCMVASSQTANAEISRCLPCRCSFCGHF